MIWRSGGRAIKRRPACRTCILFLRRHPLQHFATRNSPILLCLRHLIKVVEPLNQALLRLRIQAIKRWTVPQNALLILRGKVAMLVEPIGQVPGRVLIRGPVCSLIDLISISVLWAVCGISRILAHADVALLLPLIGSLLILIRTLVLVLSLLILVLSLLVLRAGQRPLLSETWPRRGRRIALADCLNCGQAQEQDRSGDGRRTHSFRV